MITYYSADYILPISSPKIKEGVIALHGNGEVHGVYHPEDGQLKGKEIIRYNGVLIPGFINAHCHLELSHMEGMVPRNIGLPSFLSTVMSQRNVGEDTIQQAMSKADKMMFENGIQAVGDHVNTAVSVKIKSASLLYYHTFVEIIGVSEEGLQEKIDRAKEIAYGFDHEYSSITPHAPYSCSKALFKCFAKSIDKGNTISIHNQESEEENRLFRYRKGAFITFYEKNGLPYEHFRAQGKDSLQTYVPLLPKENRLILVHNTFTSIKDISYMIRAGRDVYFCLCPKANLYIEGKIPRVIDFTMNKQKIVIGTDSLASNDTLDILEELKVIHREVPELSFEETLRWATMNGAEALGMDDVLGSFDVGKKPGLILLQDMDELQLTASTKVKRIV